MLVSGFEGGGGIAAKIEVAGEGAAGSSEDAAFERGDGCVDVGFADGLDGLGGGQDLGADGGDGGGGSGGDDPVFSVGGTVT